MNVEIKKLTPADAEEYIHFFDTTPHDDYNPEHICYCVSWCNANAKSECLNCGGWLFSMPQVRKLLQYACQDAADGGFDYIEAYPQKDTADERMFFMGFVEMYKDLGFHIYTETEDKFVMRKKLWKENM